MLLSDQPSAMLVHSALGSSFSVPTTLPLKLTCTHHPINADSHTGVLLFLSHQNNVLPDDCRLSGLSITIH